LFTHEALGHNSEADIVMEGGSILEGKLGSRIASDLVTITDDSTLEGVWGSYKYDSEGTPGRRRVVVENGVLKGYLHSLETAAKFNTEPTGSARAQDFGCRPIVRMSNTGIQAGNKSFGELLKGIDHGIMLSEGLGGYVSPEKGQFVFSAGEGWIIRKGELAEHIRDVNMSGILLETLMKIDGVSREYEMPTLKGFCGKDGQTMPVGAGGPYVRVKELMIGGQE
jgi:TldD protein